MTLKKPLIMHISDKSSFIDKRTIIPVIAVDAQFPDITEKFSFIVVYQVILSRFANKNFFEE